MAQVTWPQMASLEFATQPPTLPVAPPMAGADRTLSPGRGIGGVDGAALTLGSAMTSTIVTERLATAQMTNHNDTWTEKMDYGM